MGTPSSIPSAPTNPSTTTTTTSGGTTDPTAILFNSGFDANVGFFSCIPQPGDAIIYDEHIHASVHDGMRASRVEPGLRKVFGHNDLDDLQRVLVDLQSHTRPRPSRLASGSGSGRCTPTPTSTTEHPFKSGHSSIFISVESLYSMDGTFSPLLSISNLLCEMFPHGNAYLVVDEAHATGIYGPKGRGRVAELGLEGRVLARLHTFGKALGGSGG
ncbi:hypothetical protein MD484_g2215, partial [Candolleomyces efflorescens]